ncbi:MAG: hypothetical protein JXX29_13740 [Deltaproteobacteria bacterium]|nr:hypothetical protein [Deltaproteobacteria bacterium]MBN2672739.1 hypothetical protein [Deltaproteobacteria bacterium]
MANHIPKNRKERSNTDETFVLVEATQASVNDLTQPLTSLMTMFAVFKHRMDPDPAVKKMIAAMEEQIEKMGDITRRLSRLTEDTTRIRQMRQGKDTVSK